MVLWLVIVASFFVQFGTSQCADPDPEIYYWSELAESTGSSPPTWSLSLYVPLDDDVHSVIFVNATNPVMDLYGEIVPGMNNPYWQCMSEVIPFPTQAIFNVNGCYTQAPNIANACHNIWTLNVQWAQIMEGNMFWFLLTHDPETDLFNLTSHIDVDYYDFSETRNRTDRYTTVDTDLDSDKLLNEYGIEVPDLEVRVTAFSTGIPTNGISTITMSTELYASNETMWNILTDVPPTLETTETAINAADAVVSQTGDRSWDISFDVSVCDLTGPATVYIWKGLQDSSVRYFAPGDIELNLQSLCPSSPIGTLPAEGTLTFYSDSAYTTTPSSFFIGDTVYACAQMTGYGTVSSVSLDSFSVTSTSTDITSDTSTASSTSDTLCISFSLDESFEASLDGVTTTFAGTYSITYDDSRRRRLLLKVRDVSTLERTIRIRNSGCHFQDGKVAYLGDVQRVPCPHYGLETQVCENFHWETVTDTCTYFYVSQLTAAGQVLSVLFTVSVLTFVAYSLFSWARPQKLL